MDMDLSFQSGFDPDSARQTFESMLSTADSRLLAAMMTGGLNIERDAKRGAPVDTGNLRASIESDTSSSRNSIRTEVGTNTEYAPFIEFGTSQMAAQPFLRPALDGELRSLERRIQAAVIEAAQREGNG